MKKVLIDGVEYVPAKDDGKVREFKLAGKIIKIDVFMNGAIEIVDEEGDIRKIYIHDSLLALYDAVELSKKRRRER